MREFILKCKEIQSDGITEEELQVKVEKLKEEVRTKNNPYLSALLAKQF